MNRTQINTGLLALSLTLFTSGCQTDKKTETTTSTTSTTAGTTTKVGTSELKPPSSNAEKLQTELDDIPQLKPVSSMNLLKMPGSTVICTVDGSPITVSTFKREFQQAIISLQSMLSLQPQRMGELLHQAKEVGLTLSDDEKKRMLDSAHSPTALEGKTLAAFLKERKMTEAQFNEQVLNLGLAFKCGTKIIESQLLSEMVNRELVLKEAYKAGLKQKAVNDFVQIKASRKYKQYVEQSRETPEQIQNEIISSQMVKQMLERIAKDAPVTDEQIAQAYEKNKEQFKHGDRIRLSHIVLAAPSVDAGPVKSVKTQIQEQEPGLSGAALDKEVKRVKDEKLATAKDLLNKAKHGADFKTLADTYSDDIPSRMAKNGGDLGFKDMSTPMNPDILKIMAAVNNLPAGTVAPEIVETNFGYHVVKVTEREKGGYRPLSEVKNELKEAISQVNREQAKNNWLLQHRKLADIKLSDEVIKAAQVPDAAATTSSSKAPSEAATPLAAEKNSPANLSGQAKGNGTVNQ